jgi:hypothetical protein
MKYKEFESFHRKSKKLYLLAYRHLLKRLKARLFPARMLYYFH